MNYPARRRAHAARMVPDGAVHEEGDEKKEVPRISKWFIKKSFDTASECEAERSGLSQQGKDAFAKGSRDPTTFQELVITCIASDDPRLAK